MTPEKFRDIFARFQNLNLLTLIEDLRVGKIAFGGWVCLLTHIDGIGAWPTTDLLMCPLQHGMRHVHRPGRGLTDEVIMQNLGVTYTLADEFINWWDEATITKGYRKKQLLTLLKSIFAERLEDADAVQQVLEEQPVEVLA